MNEVKRTLVFVHIPKTGGSTLNAVLDKQYEKIFSIDGLRPKDSLEQFKSMDKKQRASYEVIRGHLTLQLIEYISNPILLTLLRDPVDQFISSFYYLKRATLNRNHGAVKDMENIGDFIKFAIENDIDYTQTRHLSNSMLDQSGPKMEEEGHRLLEMAKKKLARFDFVFHTKQFDESLMVLQKALEWRKMPLYIKLNQTLNRPKIGEIRTSEVEKIKYINRFDIQLFNYSKQKIKNQFSAYNINKELKNFRRINRFYANIHQNSIFRFLLESYRSHTKNS